MITFKKACVTGGAGFIGTHLVRALLEKGIAIRIIDDLSVGKKEAVPDGAVLIEGNILDREAMSVALADSDIVFHLAARVAIRSSFDYVVEDTMTNVAGTASVLKQSIRSRKVKKIISASSMAVYADCDKPTPIEETYPTKPVSPYGISKLALEQLTHSMAESAGIDSTVLRLFNTYGPGQQLSPYVGVVTIFVNKLKEGLPPLIFGDGEQCRDFVHVEDVVAGFLGAMYSDVTGKTFNIGSGIPTSVNSVFSCLQKIMNSKGLEPQHVEKALGELRYSIANINLAQKEINYMPKHRFISSIADVVNEILN